MERYLRQIRATGLFHGFAGEELEAMVRCLATSFAEYGKEELIVQEGDDLAPVGLVIEGRVRVQRERADGAFAVLDELGPGQLFGESFVSTRTLQMPVSLWSVRRTVVLFFDHARLFTTCPNDCAFHKRFVGHIFESMSARIIALNRTISILKHPTIRGKLTAFLEHEREKSGKVTFTISLNRGELAEYLGVNRSAMTRELYQMQEEGLLTVEGNTFCLLR